MMQAAPAWPAGWSVVRDLVARWRAWRSSPATALRWGLPWLERRLAPPYPGGLLVVGARTNNGKSYFVLELAVALAVAGFPVAYLSAEDAPHEVGRRLEAIGYHGPLLAAGFPEPRVSAMLAAIEEAGRAGAKFVVIDYLQVLGYDLDVQVFGEVGAVSRAAAELKAACKRAGVVGVLVSQLRRPMGNGGGPLPVPNLHELKGSGDIENVAEWVVLLWQNRARTGVTTEVAKSKSGAVGARGRFRRDPDSGRLTELVDGDQEGDDGL